ncbi:MAG: hypothetical protein QM778_31885 [Myxococcales bacterium]
MKRSPIFGSLTLLAGLLVVLVQPAQAQGNQARTKPVVDAPQQHRAHHTTRQHAHGKPRHTHYKPAS